MVQLLASNGSGHRLNVPGGDERGEEMADMLDYTHCTLDSPSYAKKINLTKQAPLEIGS